MVIAKFGFRLSGHSNILSENSLQVRNHLRNIDLSGIIIINYKSANMQGYRWRFVVCVYRGVRLGVFVCTCI